MHHVHKLCRYGNVRMHAFSHSISIQSDEAGKTLVLQSIDALGVSYVIGGD